MNPRRLANDITLSNKSVSCFMFYVLLYYPLFGRYARVIRQGCIYTLCYILQKTFGKGVFPAYLCLLYNCDGIAPMLGGGRELYLETCLLGREDGAGAQRHCPYLPYNRMRVLVIRKTRV